MPPFIKRNKQQILISSLSFNGNYFRHDSKDWMIFKATPNKLHQKQPENHGHTQCFWICSILSVWNIYPCLNLFKVDSYKFLVFLWKRALFVFCLNPRRRQVFKKILYFVWNRHFLTFTIFLNSYDLIVEWLFLRNALLVFNL